jgi:hypothetical protein
MSVIRSRFRTSIVVIAVIFTAVFLADYRYQRSYAERTGIKYPNFFDFIYEITHDYDGPVEGIARYLNAHGDKDDVVAITYGDMPLKFYTQMKIVGGLTGEDLSPAKEADWVIFRKQLFKGNVEVAEYFIKNIPKPNYEMILIDYPDIPYENREDPKEHRFRTAVNEDRVIIYRRIK